MSSEICAYMPQALAGPRRSLESNGPDLIAYLCGYLSGRDLLAFCETSKSISSSLTESNWKQLFKRDFGAHGLDARNVLEALHPGISWKDTYWHCVNRQVFICRGLKEVSISLLSNWEDHVEGLNSLKPMAVDLPSDMILRDIGLAHSTVYALSIEGTIRAMRIDGVDLQFSDNAAGEIENQPVPFMEMTVLPNSDVVAVDAVGIWWLWNESQWTAVFEKPIWPGTLSSTYWGTAVALSACGRYVYAADNAEPKVYPIPSLASGPPLEHIDNFLINANFGMKSIMACLQLDGRTFVLLIPKSLDDEAELSFEFGYNDRLVGVCLLKYGDAFVEDEDEDGYDVNEDRERLNQPVMQFTAANGEVLKGVVDADPAEIQLVSSQQQLPKSCIQERVFTAVTWVNIRRTSAGELYCSGDLDPDNEYLKGRDLSQNLAQIKVPPVTKFTINEGCILALCFI